MTFQGGEHEESGVEGVGGWTYQPRHTTKDGMSYFSCSRIRATESPPTKQSQESVLERLNASHHFNRSHENLIWIPGMS